MIWIRKVLNRNTLLIIALILGLVWNEGAVFLSPFSLYILTLMMTVSLTSFQLKQIFPLKKTLQNAVIALFLNYILFGIVLIFIAWLLLPQGSPLLIGFWFIVVSPPGVVIVPFSLLYGGDSRFSVIAVVVSSIFLLLLFPIVYLLLIPKETPVDFFKPLYILTVSVLLPVIISRFLVKGKVNQVITYYRSWIIDVSFFFIVFIVIGVNSDLILNDFSKLLIPIIILVIFLFGIGSLFREVLKKINISKPKQISYLLVFLVKNNPFSAVVSLMLAGKIAAIPSVALSIVLLLYLMCFSIIHKKVV